MGYAVPVGSLVTTNKDTRWHHFGPNKQIRIISHHYGDKYTCEGISMHGDCMIKQHIFRDQFYHKDPIQ